MVEIKKSIYIILGASIAIVAGMRAAKEWLPMSVAGIVDCSATGSIAVMDSTSAQDAETEGIIATYRDSIASKMSEVLCISDSALACRRPDSEMMHFMADALMSESKQFARGNGLPIPDAAICNVGGIRDNIPAGQVTVMNAFQISPFENYTVILEADSAQVTEILNHAAERGGEAISGMTFRINCRRPATLNELHRGKAKDILINGEALRGDRIYYIATLDYLADGGDAFDCMIELKRFDTSVLFREMLIGYLRKLGCMGVHITPTKEARIVEEK